MADVFALRDSTLNAFLYADVCTEANGSRLTMLSMLARLGKDPWAEAAVWSRTSKEAAVDAITQSIVLMHPHQPPDESAREAALRVVGLLPKGPGSLDARAGAGTTAAALALQDGRWMIIGCALIYLALAAGMGLASRPNAAAVMPPVPAAAVPTK